MCQAVSCATVKLPLVMAFRNCRLVQQISALLLLNYMFSDACVAVDIACMRYFGMSVSGAIILLQYNLLFCQLYDSVFCNIFYCDIVSLTDTTAWLL